MRLLALPQDWRYGVLELGQQICREEMPEKRRLRALENVISGKKSFELRKNDRGYKQGDSLKMLEFKDGKHTGRTIDADIIYMLEDYTGLTEGYCILGIRVTDYTGKVSETDTESGAVNV